MSTLKMVLHVEKVLKTTIQKHLSKSQKFARKISVVEFRYSQIINLRHFTYDSEPYYDLMKFYFETLLEILVSSQISSESPNFLYSECLINFM